MKSILPAEYFRGRRLRTTQGLRDLTCEIHLHPDQLIMPYFVMDSDEPMLRRPVHSMPGVFQFGLKQLCIEVADAVRLGLRSVILFGLPKGKDAEGSGAYADDGIIQRAVYLLREQHPELTIITDVCLCEYTSHGHCGLIDGETVLNDLSLDYIARTAVSHAKAGAHIVAPSDMMDGRVQAIRRALDNEGFAHVPIMSYAVKFASAYYGPFREAAEGAPRFGDRKSYQMDPANRREAFREAEADIAEGADMLVVKPGQPYLDVVRDLRNRYDVPLVVYQVSGEYALIKAASQQGWVNEADVVRESLIGFRRAGADLIISYFTVDMLRRQFAPLGIR